MLTGYTRSIPQIQQKKWENAFHKIKQESENMIDYLILQIKHVIVLLLISHAQSRTRVINSVSAYGLALNPLGPERMDAGSAFCLWLE